MRRGHFLAFPALAMLGSCTPTSDCQRDWDCSGGLVCANTHECLSSSDVRRAEILWTVFGQQASTTTCPPIDHLELTVFDAAGDSATYSPVPCATGRFVFDKLPRSFDSASLTAYVGGSFAEGEQGDFDADGVVWFDFSQGSIVVDAGVPDVDAAPPP